jgi:hypothetical protein
MDFEENNGHIKSRVSSLTQALTFTEVIRRNMEDMIDHGKSLRKKKI